MTGSFWMGLLAGGLVLVAGAGLFYTFRFEGVYVCYGLLFAWPLLLRGRWLAAYVVLAGILTAAVMGYIDYDDRHAPFEARNSAGYPLGLALLLFTALAAWAGIVIRLLALALLTASHDPSADGTAASAEDAQR